MIYSSLIHVVYFIFIAVLYVCTIYFFKKNNAKLKFSYMILLAIYHIIFQVLYWLYTIQNGGDALMYYETARLIKPEDNFLEYFGVGTKFMQSILYPFASPNYLNISYFGCYFLFGYFGFVGFLFLYKIVNQYLPKQQSAILLLFLPNLHFWSTAIGKDSLIFFILMIFFDTLNRPKIGYIKLIFLLALCFFIRPHIALCLGGAFLFALLFKNKTINIFVKSSVLIVFFAGLILAAQYFLENIIHVDEGDVVGYLESRQEQNLGGGSSVVISEYGLFMKLFTYLYRPFFFDAKNPLWLMISFENLIYLSITLKIILSRSFFGFVKKLNFFETFCLIYFIITLLLLSYTTANLGIALRQKIMILPALFILVLSYSKNNKTLVWPFRISL